MGKKIRVGSRESKLAITQAKLVMENMKLHNPDVELELVTMKTTGDKILNKTLDKIGGKGLFIKELERALVDETIDICVHSYKDMPMEENDDLPIVALSKREDPRDVLILPIGVKELAYDKPIGSSSARRTIQLKEIYPHIATEPIRGNVLTRLEKLDDGQFGALVLAYAGIKRLGLQSRISRLFTTTEVLPAASQGILAVQGRKGEDYSFLAPFHSRESMIISLAERSFVGALNGGCSSPVAAWAELNGNEIRIFGMYVDGENQIYKQSIVGEKDRARQLGETLARNIKPIIGVN